MKRKALPEPAEIKTAADARSLMQAVLSRTARHRPEEVAIGDLPATLSYYRERQNQWIHANLVFPHGTPGKRILALLPAALDATLLRHFPGAAEYALANSTNTSWYAQDGRSQETQPVIDDFYEHFIFLNTAPMKHPGPVLYFSVALFC